MSDDNLNPEWSSGKEIGPAEDEEPVEYTITGYEDPETAAGLSAPDIFKTDPNFTIQLFNSDITPPVPKYVKHGFMASIPMLCLKKDCPYFDVCGVFERDMREICVKEQLWVENAFAMYMANLNVPPDDLVNMVTIKDLITIDLKIERINMWMKKHPGEDFIEQIMSIDPSGTREAKRLEEHPSHILLDKLMNRREKILEQMMGTKRAKRKIVQAKKSSSQRMQERRAQERRRNISKPGTQRRDVETEGARNG
jgi:hypothetical protein